MRLVQPFLGRAFAKLAQDAVEACDRAFARAVSTSVPTPQAAPGTPA